MLIAAAHLRRGDLLVTVPSSYPRRSEGPTRGHCRVLSNCPRIGFRTRRWIDLTDGSSRVWENTLLLDVEVRA